MIGVYQREMLAPPKLPLAVTTLYAELLDLTADDAVLGYANVGYTKKAVKGRTYWYRQYSTGRERVQKYLGPETPELLVQIDRERQRSRDRRDELRQRKQLCRALIATIGRTMDSTTAKILKALSEAGAFSAGAVLIGSHAYGIYAAMLGRNFRDAHIRTGDVDFAAIHVAVEHPVSFSEVIQAAEERMLLVPPAPHARITTKLKMRGSNYRVELLTPARDDSGKPVVIENLKFGAQPLPYLDYLIEGPVDAVAPVDVGIRVKVPAPERFALHKLIVAQARDRSYFAKREKDLAQAEELIAVLREDLPEELAAAWQDLVDRGGDYADKALASLRLLEISPDDISGA